jgi:hypothetical protein
LGTVSFNLVLKAVPTARIIALLTQQLGGSLHYERLEAGCRVVLRIPLTPSKNPAVAAPIRISPAGGSNERI